MKGAAIMGPWVLPSRKEPLVFKAQLMVVPARARAICFARDD